MKLTKLLLAVTVCIAVIASCKNSDKKQHKLNPLIGQWKIDSIASKDSNDLGALLLAMSLQDHDSVTYNLTFAPDTMTLLQKDTTTKSLYQFNEAKNEIFILEDSTVLTYHNMNDSLLMLTSKDSTTLYLRKL